jgi:hypothetical protein
VLEAEQGRIEPKHMAAALGDSVDFFTGDERVVGNTVSVVTTIKSTVWDPSAQRFWVASRGESPVGLGDFVEVDAERFWESATEEGARTLPGYRPRDPRLVEGMRHYREAYRAYHMENHLPDYRERALAELRKAARAFPTDGNLWVQAGIVAFGLRQFDEARGCFEQARVLKLSPHTAQVCDLYLARCMDIAGDRGAALALYRSGSATRDPKLRKAMLRGIRKPYRARETSRMLIDLQFPDTFHY